MVAIGERVQLKGQPGTVRYVGRTDFAPGEWVGLEFDTPTGKNNGTVQGKEYFQCTHPGNYGVFVRPTLLESKSPPPQDVVAVVNRLQQKLRDAQNERNAFRESVEAITQKLKVARSELSSTVLSLESATVETEYLREQNTFLMERTTNLQTTYDDLMADYEILKEELDIYKELEDAVSLQLPSESDLTIEDFTVLMQLNKRLELANSSLQNLMITKENNLNSEISFLKTELAHASTSIASYNATAKKLNAAETSIKLLQEQLESTFELVSIVERVTNENEALHRKIDQLILQIEDLTEINEIDKALEAEHLQKEDGLRRSIAKLNEALEKETAAVASLLISNKQLKEDLYKSSQSGEFAKNNDISKLANELTELKSQHEQSLKENLTIQTYLEFLESFYTKMVPPELHEVVRLLCSTSLMYKRVFTECRPEKISESAWRRLQDILLHVIAALEYYHHHLNIEPLTLQFNSFLEIYKSDLDAVALQNAIFSLEYVVLEETLPLMEHTWMTSKLLSSCALAQIQLEKLTEYALEAGKGERLTQAKSKCQDTRLIIEAARALHSLAHSEQPLIELKISDEVIDYADFSFLDELIQELDSVFDAFKNKLVIPTDMVSIYSQLKEGGSKKDKDALDSVQIELEEKKRRIQDLQLHVGLLEKNMTLSLAEKTLEVNEAQNLLAEAHAEIGTLVDKLGDIQNENADLTRQMEAFLTFNDDSKYQQTKYFYDKTENLESTATEVLIDEIQLLKRMLEPQRERNSWNKHIDWLHEPLLTTVKCSSPTCKRGLAFLEEAHQQRRTTRDLIRSIPKPVPSSQRLRYLRSGV